MNATDVKTVIRIGDKVYSNISKIASFFDETLKNSYEKNKNSTLRETFQRGWKSFWDMSRSSHFEKGNLEETSSENTVSVLSNFVTVCSKAKHKELVVIDKKHSKDKDTCVKSAVRKDVSDIQFTLKFEYNNENKTLTVSLDSYETTVDEIDIDAYLKALDYELNKIKKEFENKYPENKILENFMDTLHAHNLTSIKGSDAKIMREIYPKIGEHFPNFKNFAFFKKKELLLSACLMGMCNERKDIYTFSKAMFEVLVSANAINIVKGFGNTYKKICEHRKDLKDPENPNDIWAKNVLIFVDFMFNGNLRTSFHASDLWLLMAC